jgi:isoquinoline 1-oxidoreductase subunit beta
MSPARPTFQISRRELLWGSATATAGLVLGFHLPAELGAAAQDQQAPASFAPNAWIAIDPTGQVTLTVARSEMGQGVLTALPMILADELEVDWTAVRIRQADAHPTLYGNQGTGGSASVRTGWEPLRKAGATARAMLIAAAAERFGVPAAGLKAEKGGVVDPGSGKRLTYGELAEAAGRQTAPADPPLKDPKDFHLIGKRLPRLDTPPKVDGSAGFGLDVRVPGMVYAALARCPVFGGKTASVKADAAKALSGVRDILDLGEAVAVVADNSWAAIEGCRRLEIAWDEGPNASFDSEGLRKRFAEQAAKGGKVWREEGDFAKALDSQSGGKSLEAVYEMPFLSHAPMEPGNCTASVTAGKCEIWAPTQVPQSVQRAAAELLKLDPSAVTVHVTLLGGGFGRRLETDYALEAVRVSQKIGKPVKVVWTREEDMRHDFYRPASYHLLRGAVGADGWPIAFAHTFASPSLAARRNNKEALETGHDRGAENQAVFAYAVPHLRLEFAMVNSPVPIGALRAVYAPQAAYPTESFLDELAAAGGKDPLEVRRRLLAGDREIGGEGAKVRTGRLRGVLELAAAKAGWGTPLKKGLYRGIACFPSFSSYAAQVAEVEVSGKDFRVHRVVCAVDVGTVVNPDILESQVEGSVVFGLSAALKGAITVAKGRVEQGNFGEYELLRLREMPRVEVYTVPSSEPPTGIGEPAVPVVAPAVANALLAATGKPVRRLPMRLA